MTVWIVCYLPQVGDEIVEKVFREKVAAETYMASQRMPWNYSLYPWPVE